MPNYINISSKKYSFDRSKQNNLVYFFVPLIITIVLFSFPPEQSIGQSSSIKNSKATIQTLAGNKNIHFLIELNSSQTIYDRQATFGIWSFGDRLIVINGSITNIPLNRTDLANKIIMLQAVQNNKLIYEKSVKTDKFGNFKSNFFPPEDGTVKITAKLDNLTTSEGVISIIVKESAAPMGFLAIFISAAVGLMVLWIGSTKRKTNGNAIKNHYTISGILLFGGIVVLTIFAYFVLYTFAPFGEAGNAAFATAMIVPIAGFIFQTFKSQSG